jgi:tetratricopeptide (TPR) repeat protein
LTTLQIPNVIQLLQTARELWTAGKIEAADCVYQAAVLCDGERSKHRLQAQLAFAEFLFKTEQFAESIEAYIGLLGLAQDQNDNPLKSVCSNNLAGCYRAIGEPEKAIALQGHSFKSALVEGSFDQQSVDLCGQAVDAIQTGQFDHAEDLLLRSLAMDQRENNRAGQAADCGNLGVLAGLRGDTAVGIRFLGRAYRLHREIEDASGCGTDLVNLAELFETLSRNRLAEKCLTRAMSCFQQAGANESFKRTLFRLREVRGLRSVLEHDPLLN